ncbi:MAG: transposase [Actinomycetia bacterium]|nr:transposase [Actinomycetes bacterium]
MPGSPSTRYPEEFKREAVRLYRSGEHGGIDRTAKAIGAGHMALRRWVHQAEIDSGRPRGSPPRRRPSSPA